MSTIKPVLITISLVESDWLVHPPYVGRSALRPYVSDRRGAEPLRVSS